MGLDATTQLKVLLWNLLTELFLTDKGEIPFAVFIFLSKAFDTLDHITLMHKLSYYGVQSYLSNRKQYVQFDNIESD